jgi:hypothetical protein
MAEKFNSRGFRQLPVLLILRVIIVQNSGWCNVLSGWCDELSGWYDELSGWCDVLSGNCNQRSGLFDDNCG